MTKSRPVARRGSPGSDSDGTDQSIVPTTCTNLADSFDKKDHSWFVTSEVPADFTIQVHDTTFNVHKFPLVSKSGYIGRIELQHSISNFGYDIKLENFPGGPETFEIILKFCYGIPVDLKPQNVAPLRCASEYLEMTEELEEGNLISKSEAFLTFVVLSSWRDSITVLKACSNLTPWAENLQIVKRCSDSIARKASTTREMINDGWWFDDVATLCIDHFMRIITVIKAKGPKPEIIGSCIMCYAEKWLPCMDVELERLRGHGNEKNELQLSILSGRREEGAVGHNKEIKTIIESLVSVLPPQKDVVPCKFLSWMLKLAIMYSATPALTSELEKRVGMVLEDANINDLLIPNYRHGDQGTQSKSPDKCTMHDVDVVQRIVEYYLMHEQQQQEQEQKPGRMDVCKLLDSYLVEVARDPNLSITKFQVLAETLPENGRLCHDGLYRAIDTYLKIHPLQSEHDRRRLCKIMNSEKLSLDACEHAAQNDRLPLRTVIQMNMQVLFAEQVKMRAAMQGKDPAPSGDISEHEGGLESKKIEVHTLKAELEMVKAKMAELQRDYLQLQQEYEKLNKKQKNVSTWIFGWKKLKNSSFFHGKVEVDDGAGEGQQKPELGGSKKSLRRRKSLS